MIGWKREAWHLPSLGCFICRLQKNSFLLLCKIPSPNSMFHCLSTFHYKLPIIPNKTQKQQRFLQYTERFHFTIMANIHQEEKKPKILCLHGFRTSGEIMKKQVGKWPDSVLGKLDLDFLDGPFPAKGKSDVEGFFPPPYYEWFQYIPVGNFSIFFLFLFFLWIWSRGVNV